MPLEINLLPEFGWSIKNQPVYGPGSVFQGFIKLNITESQLKSADRLRVVFHSTESAYITGYSTPVYHNQLFGSQKILWKKKNLQSPSLTHETDISIPFIIQIPMVQFPPSSNVVSELDGLSYHCNFVLSAYLEDLDNKQDAAILKSHKTIVYMPFVETRISKTPVSITISENTVTHTDIVLSNEQSSTLAPSIHVNMPSFDYVPGDTIPLSLIVQNIQRKAVELVSIKLMQVRIWNRSSFNTKGKMYAGEKKTLHTIFQQNMMNSEILPISPSAGDNTLFPIDTKIDIPADVLPSFAYSPMFSVKYQLQISVKTKGKIWSKNCNFMEVPVNIGTLGYGIRSSQEIKIYSTFKSVFEIQQQDESSNSLSEQLLPVPKFLDVIEYEESLPVYNNDRLPAYDTPSFGINHNQHLNCIM